MSESEAFLGGLDIMEKNVLDVLTGIGIDDIESKEYEARKMNLRSGLDEKPNPRILQIYRVVTNRLLMRARNNPALNTEGLNGVLARKDAESKLKRLEEWDEWLSRRVK